MNITKRLLLCLFLITQLTFIADAQCTLEVKSSDGYTVDVLVDPVNILVGSTDCNFGYSFTVELMYDISFSGSNIPASLYSLIGYIYCSESGSSEGLYFDLPNSGGQGTVISGNTYTSNTDCENATPASLGCRTMDIVISGPGIPEQRLTCERILPIELLSFTAAEKTGKVKLQWITLSELRNDYFTIEKSKNGSQWSTVGKEGGAQYSLQKKSYSMIDDNPFSGVSYYRLKQTDTDGAYSYSPIRSVVLQDSENGHIIYPNPASTHLYIDKKTDKKLDLRVYNSKGIDMTSRIHFTNHESSVKLEINALPQGIYMISIEGEMHKFIKI